MDGGIGLARLRLDGFASVHADNIGMLTTIPFRCEGTRLFINAIAPKGSVRAAVLDAGGSVVPDLSLDDCVVFRGDSVGHKVTWKSGLGLDCLAGRMISLRFELRQADLYSFSIVT